MSNSKDFLGEAAQGHNVNPTTDRCVLGPDVARELARSIFKAHEQTMDTYYRKTMFEPAVVLIEAALRESGGATGMQVTSFQCEDAWKLHTDPDHLCLTNWAGMAETLNSLLAAAPGTKGRRKLVEKLCEDAHQHYRCEPGADTGTTVAEELSGMLAERMIKLAIKIQGPYATFGPPESLERRKKSHQERIEELTGMLTTEFAECLERGTTPPPSTAEFEPLLRGELKHGRSCPAVGAPMDEGNCDCGLKWRIRLQTEMTLRNAWEKRTYEAEAALAAAETTPSDEGLERLDEARWWHARIGLNHGMKWCCERIEELERAAERGTTPWRETAWLIERHDMTRTQWLCCDSGEFEWTADPLKPLRLARREDAEQLALLALPNRDDIDVRITEHQWGM